MTIKHSVELALKLLQSNKITDGIHMLDKVLQEDPNNLQAREFIAKAYLAVKNYELAERHLKSLLELKPTFEPYIQAIADLFNFQKRWSDLSQVYLTQLELQPQNANALFNCAYYMKLSGNFEKAVECYERAIEVGIRDDFEVSLNLGIIYSEHLSSPQKAIKVLKDGIIKHPDKDSLYYNLGNVYEQLGEKELALEYFKKAHSKNPKNYDALARQADIGRMTSLEEPLIEKLKMAFESKEGDVSSKVNLAYALGKTNDDCKAYSSAFKYYEQANKLDQKTLPLYNPKKFEIFVDNIIQIFSKEWLVTQPIIEPLESPIFICGMFRSGSTLCEQILAAHSEVDIGGEQEFFHRTVSQIFPRFPLDVPENYSQNSKMLLSRYLLEIKQALKDGSQLTDKRPDNFLYLGLIKMLMPNAKIVWTRREMLDNCLSVYFLRLGASMSYATDLNNIVHYYRQQERLMEHWKFLFGEDIYELNYDKLVDSPEEQIQLLLNNLELKWEDDCVDFHKVENQVKTASVWQVRQPLYKRSSGRWKNYQSQLKSILVDVEL